MLRAVWAGLAWMCLSGLCLGETNSAWFARPWQSDDDLPNNTISGLAQTPDGYLWLGTPSSLVRFDGLRFEDFSPTNFVAPPNRGTITMLRGRDGALWLALDRGAVVRLQGGATKAYTFGLPNSIPNGLAEAADGALWIAYRGGAVYRLKDGEATACTSADGLPAGIDICAVAGDRQGGIWFAKGGHFGRIHDGVFQTLRQFDTVQPARLATAKGAGVWLCYGFHLFRSDAEGKLQDAGEFHPEREGTVATVLLEDHEGAVWIGTSFSGLFRQDATGFEPIQTSHEEILSLTEDAEGNLWVGTAGGGLNRVRRRAVRIEDQAAGLPFAGVQSLCQDTAGTIWAATLNGVLARRIDGKWSPLPPVDNFPIDANCVAADPSGAVWIGNRLRGGLYCWRDGHLVNWGDASQLRGQTIHTLLVSRTGDLWIGEETPHAIQCLRAGKLLTFEVPPDCRIIRAMAEDAAGDIWAGTSKGVLLRISHDHLSEVTPRQGHELASIRCLTATPDGALWLGYAGWGLGRLQNGQYAEIRSEQGLYDDYISHLIPDGRGWLWFGANRGVFKVRLQELDAVAAARGTRVRSIHYGRGEGLPSLQGTFGDFPDVLRSQNGQLWIPMRTALVVVAPDKLGERPEAPTALLTRVTLDERTVGRYGGVLPLSQNSGGSLVDLGGPDSHLRLPPGHRRIEFEFAAPAFITPESIQFRYRLAGLDDDWVEAGTRHNATYSRLPAGDYQFEVSTANSLGVWGPTTARLTLVVTPFFWQTWAFRIAALTVFTVLLVGVVREVLLRRLRRQLHVLEEQAALHKERARIAKDIHDDLGANLTQIALLGELAQQDRSEPDKAAQRMNTISTTARQAIKSLDEIVWAVNPRNDTLSHLIDYAGQFAVDYLRPAGLRCRLDLPEQTPSRELSTDLRHNLFLVIKEALNNIVKHARATEVWLRARVSPEALELVIEDNGCGFAVAPDNALADGLRNMRQRLTDIGGACHIDSRPGAGTRIALHLPWPRD